MIHLLGNVPNDVIVACSGGPDSMAAVEFFRNGKKNVTIAHFDHRTEHALEARNFVKEYADTEGIDIIVSEIKGEKPRDASWEEWWRDQRYSFLRSLPGSAPIVTAHHLDDAVEWWVFSSFHGTGRLIPYQNGRVIRPMLLSAKSELIRWCDKSGVQYVTDPTNIGGSNTRAFLRSNIMPDVYKINPGLRKVIQRKLKESYNETSER